MLDALLGYLMGRGKGKPDITWITPQLALGGRLRAEQVPAVARLGIGSVLDLREETHDDERLLGQYGLRLLHLPVPDRAAPSQEQLREGTEWVLQEMAADRKVLVHCEAGSGRSVTLVCAALLRVGYRLPEAYGLVRRQRWIVGPTDEQLGALEEFGQQWGSSQSGAG